MTEVKPGSYTQNLEKELEKTKMALEIAVEALNYYSTQRRNNSEAKPGDRIEYGCGCCAGIVDENGDNNFNKSVIGLTAREALEKINEACK